MNRTIFTFACTLAMLIWTCPVQAEYIFTLQGSQAWALNVDNGQVTSGSTAVTVHYVVGRLDHIRIRTVPAQQRVALTSQRPRRATDASSSSGRA